MFGEIAGWYDFLNHALSLGVDWTWRRKTIRLVKPSAENGPILDVCTGTGDLALAYWRICRNLPGIEVVGSDFCRQMLIIGDKKRKKAGADEGLGLIEADTLNLPFADGTFQIVSVAFGLRNVDDLDAGLCEMSRVCRKGGKVAILEFSTPRAWPFNILYKWYFHRILPRIGQCLARNTQGAYNYLPESVDRFPQGEAFVRRMSEAGLKTLTAHRFSFGIATLYIGTK